MIYVKKKSNEIHVCTDFSSRENAGLKYFNYPLPCPGDIFAKLDDGRFLSKIDFSDDYLLIPVEEVVHKHPSWII